MGGEGWSDLVTVKAVEPSIEAWLAPLAALA